MHHIKPKIQKADGKQRDGKGFSLNELKQASLNKADAKRLEIPVDTRRKTAHAGNIEALKAFVAQQKSQAKPRSKPERQAAKNKPKK
ncbi:MAG: ribosomal protein L13e [Candidatus Bathyarchaeota archaeon]|nr:ribosomal protein L13e [Candidatus Bathyarchaeota archaeon]